MGTPWGLTLEERFWMKVDKRGPDECWLWQGRTVGNAGYGQIGRSRGEGPPIRAHVLSLNLAGVEVPPGFHVHHRCEMPSCVNPAHLEVLSPAVHLRLHHPKREACSICGTPYGRRDRNHKPKCRPCDAARKRRERAQQKAA